MFVPKGNVLFDLMQKYNISYYDPSFEDYIVYDINGTDITDDIDAAYDQYAEASETVIPEGKERIAENRDGTSLRSSLIKAGWIPRIFAHDPVEYFEIEYDFAIGASEISTQTGWIPDDIGLCT